MKKINLLIVTAALLMQACSDDSNPLQIDDLNSSAAESSSSVKKEDSSSSAKESSSSGKVESSSSVKESSSSGKVESSSSEKIESSSSEEIKSSSSVEESSSSKKSLIAAVFTSDYTTGELRWINAEGKVSDKSLAFYQDSRVRVNGSDIFVLEGLGADNITKINGDKVETETEKSIEYQVALDKGANPIDMAFENKTAWVALQAADSLIQISTDDGKILKSIKTTKFAAEGETTPYIADIEIKDGLLYVLMQRYTYDATTWSTTFKAPGLLAIYDGTSGDLKDTISLVTKNPMAMGFSENDLYVATQGKYNESFGTDADENRGIEKINLAEKTSKLVVTGKTLGGGVNAFAVESGVAYAGVYKAWGNVPVAQINLSSYAVKNLEKVADAEGSLALKDGALYIGDRTFGSESIYLFKDGKINVVEGPAKMIAPYSIALF